MSVTENYLLEANLEDLVHGLVTGESVLEPGTRDNERIWRSDFSKTSLLSTYFLLLRSLYFKLLDKEGRRVARSMLEQVETGLQNSPDDLCY